MKTLKFSRPFPISEYDRLIQLGFKKYPDRYENYQNFLKSKLSVKIDYYPIKLDIEPVSRCNLKCKMCILNSFRFNKRSDDLKFKDFKKIIDEQIGLIEIKLQGLGEPFLNKELIKMIEYARNKLIWVRTSTNGTLLHIDENYKRAIDAGIGEIQISIDGVNKKTYETIRKKGNFKLVVKNSKLINDYQNKQNVEKTRLWFLLQKDNFHEFFDVPVFAKDLGFNRVTISLDVNAWGSKKESERYKNLNIRSFVTQKDIDKVIEIAEKIDVNLTFWDISLKYTKKNPCPWPFHRFYVSSDLKIVACCMIANPEVQNFGKYNHFKDIWFGDIYNNFRLNHILNKIPSFCQDCYQQC